MKLQNIFLAVALPLLALFSSCTYRQDLSNEGLATPEHPVVSPSGKYRLVILKGYNGRSYYQRLEIYDIENPGDERLMLSSKEEFYLRFRTYFMWDDADRVWVYSGDTGTFFWERNGGSQWQQYTFVEEDVPAPKLLKELVPESH